MVTDWRTTEDWWGMTWGWPWDPRRSANPLPPAAPGEVAAPLAANNLTALAVCQASCPWRGGLPATGILPQCQQAGCCPRLCRGCEAGWAYDETGRHIGPVKYPHSNRWECNRVKWLGMRGMEPCGTGYVVWVNNAGVNVPWMNGAGRGVAWTTAAAPGTTAAPSAGTASSVGIRRAA